MAGQAFLNSGASINASQGAGTSNNSTSLSASASASAQGSTERKTPGQPSLQTPNNPLKAPSKESSGNVTNFSAPDSLNALQNRNESQILQHLAEKVSAREPSLHATPTSDNAPGIISSENTDTLPKPKLDNVQFENEDSQDSQGLQKTARQPSFPGRAKSVGSKDVSAAVDSYNALGVSNEESSIPRTWVNQRTPSQPSVPISPRQFDPPSVDSSGGANIPDTTGSNSIPEGNLEELQKPQGLPKGSAPSQYPAPLSPLPEAEGDTWLNEANGRKDSEIPGSWPVTSGTSSTAQDWRASDTPSNSFPPLAPIPSGIDRDKAPDYPDTLGAAEPPNTNKSPKTTLFSPSSSSTLSEASDQENVRAFEPDPEGRTNITPSVPAPLGEELNNVESRMGAASIGRREPSQDTLDAAKPSLQTTVGVQSSLGAAEPSRTSDYPFPVGLSKNADIPPSPTEVEFPKDAGALSSLKGQEPSRAANNLPPLETAGISKIADFPSPSKAAESARTASWVNASGPPNQAERRYSLKTVDSPRNQSIVPASLQTAESPKTRDKGSVSNAVEFPNEDSSSPLKRLFSSGPPIACSEWKQRRAANRAAASLGTALDPHIFPTSLSDPVYETDTSKAEPEPEAPDSGVEMPRSSVESPKLPVPKIFIERVSDAPESDMAWPSSRPQTIEEKRQEGKLRQALTGALSAGASGSKTHSAGLHSPILPQIAEDVEEPKTPKIKRRRLYLRKARNVAARKTILKATLGRELAQDTKPALRRLAHGEPYNSNSQDHVQVRVSVEAS
ncbi:hypothetical protein MMC07_006879 [Pseudocyphellaria aurata]|nr:hypothetical protein [Pseudocyphellaria aurata]